MTKARRVESVLAVLVLGLFAQLHGAEVEKELEGIKKKIAKEKQGISTVQKKEGSVLKGLQRIEEQLDRKDQELKRINMRLEVVIGDLQKKEEQAQKVSQSLSARRELLKKRARALYRWQRGGSPFVFLNGGGSIAELMQRKRYLELTLAYDQRLLERLSEESGELEKLREDLIGKREQVDRERRKLVEVKEAIRQGRENKREALTSLRREKETRVRALRELEQAAHRLQTMMDEISRKAVASAGASRGPADFEAMKGKLDYPVRGEIMAAFGKTQHREFTAELFRKGIDIAASLGEEIRAVESGKVVFADRFSGYGKMLIVDHGQRYYTIYAHLADLLKRSGEPVRRGELIATVGDSDSLQGARLYFEIRKGGKALDPLPWFKKR
ncbi:MAG: peptidoglycan DD-metalloendopeptidase family protein [Deltaproteobacteria bacterium]|nr:peptidoglycan DD-metalloendopeptidase family protein [Deltaproteobacteria bacterium]